MKELRSPGPSRLGPVGAAITILLTETVGPSGTVKPADYGREHLRALLALMQWVEGHRGAWGH